jgi:hypothetical protein
MDLEEPILAIDTIPFSHECGYDHPILSNNTSLFVFLGSIKKGIPSTDKDCNSYNAV